MTSRIFDTIAQSTRGTSLVTPRARVRAVHRRLQEQKNNLDVAGQRKTIVRKAAQFITQPLFLFFTKAFSPLTLQVKYGGIKKERKKGSTAIYVESMARKHPRCETPQAACQHQENRTKAQN